MSALNQRESTILEAALKLPVKERPAYLDEACGGDAALRQRIVEALFQAQEDAVATAQAAPSSSPERTIAVPFPNEPPGEKPGDRIGHYKLLEQIGEGGMGTVWVAEQTQPIRREVALKVIKLGMDTKQVMARFEAERQALALMDHPNIAKVLDAGATETGRPYFVMERVKGIPITDYCDQHNLSTGKRLDLFVQVCHAIQHAHQKGIIHRDIKPSNILVALQDGVPVPKVIDFGIAKATSGQRLTELTLHTALAEFIGSPPYMSPEQADLTGVDIDTRSDIYSLGVLLYELLTGRTPFDAKRLFQAGMDGIRRIIREEEPPRPSTKLSTLASDEQTATAKRRYTDPPRLLHLVRGDLDWIAMKCLEKDRARRYETASGLAADIQRHLNSEPVVARPPSSAYRFQKLVRRNRLAFAAGAAVVLSLTIGLFALSYLFVREKQSRQREEMMRQKADLARVSADQARASAEQARDQMLQEKCRAEHASYVSSIGLADRFIGDLRYDDARRLLEGCAPEQRAWEWSRLAFLCRMGSVTLAGHSNQVWGIAFSADGKQVATAGFDHKVRLWDSRTGEQLRVAAEFKSYASCVAFSPDGRFMAAGSYDGTGGIWDTTDWRQVARLEKHDDRILTLAYSSDGTMIATGGGNWANSRDNSIRLWDARDGRQIARLDGHQDCIYCIRFDPRGGRLVSCSGNDTRFWNLTTLARERQESKGGAYALAFAPDGSGLAMGRGHSIVLHNLETGQETSLATEDAVWSLAITGDGRRLVAGLADKTALLVDLPDMRLASTLKGHSARVVAVAFSPDGSLVGTGSSDGLAKVWHTQGVPDRCVLPAHSRPVRSLAFSPGGELLASAGEDGLAKLWDFRTQRVVQTWNGSASGPQAVAFSGDGSRLAVALGNAALVWDLKAARELSRVTAHASAVALNHDGRRLVTVGGGYRAAHLWNAETGEKFWTLGGSSIETGSVTYRPFAEEVATGGRSPAVGLWNPEARQLLRSIDRHQLWVNLVVYSPRGDLLASSGNEGIIHIQDAEQAKPISSVRGFPTGPPAVAFSPDGRRLVYSLARGRLKELRLWEVGSGLDLLSLPGQTAPLCACFSPDGTTLASGGADGTITLWLTQAQPWTSGGNNAVPKDAAEAVAVFRQAAEQGSAAEYNLGKAYENGEGVAKDLAVAAKWYRGAAEGGNRAAMASLLNLYRRGAIEAKSPGEVVTWYHKLAEGYLNTLEPVQSAAAREDALALNNFSWLLATCPNANVRDGAAAVVFAEKAVAGTSRKAPLYLDTLAAAYAEAGQFTNAVSTQREAVGLVQGRADKAGYAARLKLYESNSPYREASQNPPPPAVDNPVEVAALLQARGRLRAQYGQWKKAIPDLARALELNPNDDLIWYLLAPLLLEDGDVAGYHKHCQAMLARFGATDDLPTVSRIAKGAMLLPLAAADLTAASKLAETAVTVGRNDARAAYFQFVKGLAEYREGRFATAAEWAKKALNKPSEDSQRDAQAYAVLAMAYHQLGQTNEARAILANAKEVTDTKLPKADSGDLGEAWNNVLIARILLREANTLIGGGGSAGSKP